jgi:hypothetical protein
MDPKSRFGVVLPCIRAFEILYTCTDPSKGQPKSGKDWRKFWNFLKATSKHIDNLLEAGGFQGNDLWRLNKAWAWDYQQWLRKLTSITKDIDVIMAAANSQGFQDIFSKSLRITPLGVISTPHDDIPDTEQWEEVGFEDKE